MTKISYPAVFHREDSGCWAEFPDLPGCFCQGESIEECYAMAQDAMGLYLDRTDPSLPAFPSPSRIEDIVRKYPEDIIMLVTYDSLEYARLHRTKAVKKTLSIPEWLNDLAVRNNINFSQVLQDALIEKLYR